MTSSLGLNANSLSGTIPTDLALLTRVSYLTLANNALVYPTTSDGEAAFAQATRACGQGTTTCVGLPPLSCSAFSGDYLVARSEEVRARRERAART